MIDDALVQAGLSGGVGIGIGFAIGYALKKVFKLLLIGVGILFTIMVAMQMRGWLTVHWDVINQQVQGALSNTTTDSGLVSIHSAQVALGNLGIPLTGGLGIGITAGFIRG